MSDQSQRTEKATPQRIRKAREEGDFVNARQLIAGVQFFSFVWILSVYGGAWVRQMGETMTWSLRAAVTTQLDNPRIIAMHRTALLQCVVPLVWAGLALAAIVFLTQMTATQFGFSAKRLMPSADRLNPASNLSGVFHRNASSLVQALVLLPLFGYILYKLSAKGMAELVNLPRMPLSDGIAYVRHSLMSITWQAALFFFIFGLANFGREWMRYMKKLKMSKQDIKDEAKQSEGSPLIKGRIRKIQMEIRRRRMMASVPSATAVIVNPTHYSVAIRYLPGQAGAPVVVAKGKDKVAARIRQLAVLHGVPIVENPPLARGLYAAVDVNQEIPPHLYRAVAEVLSYIYRLTGQRAF